MRGELTQTCFLHCEGVNHPPEGLSFLKQLLPLSDAHCCVLALLRVRMRVLPYPRSYVVACSVCVFQRSLSRSLQMRG